MRGTAKRWRRAEHLTIRDNMKNPSLTNERGILIFVA
jgi:hypothetical protein